jgi:hypothetical protein
MNARAEPGDARANGTQQPDRRFPTGVGKSDTHARVLSDGGPNPHHSAGTDYHTITGAEIVAMMASPQAVPKASARWFIPSTYAGCDARDHSVQRQCGQFWWLCVDVDHNNLALADVGATLEAVAPGASRLIYNTRSSTGDDRRWRALLPLQEPLAGADYTDTALAFFALLTVASGGVLIPDPKLALTGQLVYLPNRGASYEHEVRRGQRLALTQDHSVISRRDADRAASEAARQETAERRARKAAERPKLGDGPTPVERFNAANSVADLLERYGYARLGATDNWRSPHQTSGSYATRDYGDHWVSLSGSDASAGLGQPSKSGARCGDAFDLFVAYEHGGRFEDAVRAYGEECRAKDWSDFSYSHAGDCGQRSDRKRGEQQQENDEERPRRGPDSDGASDPNLHAGTRGGGWRYLNNDIVRDAKGRPLWCVETAAVIMSFHPEWLGCLAFDEFRQTNMILRPIPGTPAPAFVPRELADHDLVDAARWFCRNGFPTASKAAVADAALSVGRRTVISPVRHFLEELVWDGVERLSMWLIDLAGAEDTLFTRGVSRAWMISAVARALRPGCKADHVLVLEGPQGIGKSTLLRILASDDWFCDSLPDLTSKDASTALRGHWIIELAELSATRRAEIETVKAFITRQAEIFRPAYARVEVLEPRRCVFAGTSNRSDWQRDETGGRRWWPVRVGPIDIAGLAAVRGQLWAEAVVAFRAGEPWWLKGEAESLAIEAQAERAEEDPWMPSVAGYLAGRSSASCRALLEAVGLESNRMTRADSLRASALLLRLGWQRDGKFTFGAEKGLARFVPPPAAVDDE